MLLQSYGGLIKVFPAVPPAWKDVSFRTLRAEGAFLVSARREGGTVREVRIDSEKGGAAVLRNPFGPWHASEISGASVHAEAGVLRITFSPGGRIVLDEGGD